MCAMCVAIRFMFLHCLVDNISNLEMITNVVSPANVLDQNKSECSAVIWPGVCPLNSAKLQAASFQSIQFIVEKSTEM